MSGRIKLRPGDSPLDRAKDRISQLERINRALLTACEEAEMAIDIGKGTYEAMLLLREAIAQAKSVG